MIDRETVDHILNTADIVEVISEFVTLRKAGSNWKALCPFHNEKTPSFMVSPTKGIFKCFSCGKAGNVAHFLMEHEQMTFPEALRWLAKKYHIEIHERELSAEDIQQNNLRESLLIVNKWACDYFQKNLFEIDEGQNIGLSYFRNRGLRDDTIKTYQLGYCLAAYDALAKEAKKRGYNEDFLVATGLCNKHENGRLTDKYRGRVTFPIQALDGQVIGFGARTLSSDKNVAKYMNSPESVIYHKSDVLYGIYQAKAAIQKADRCFLVEGYMDVISMHQSGIANVVASSGTSLTFGQIRLIHRFTSNLTVLYDGDMAGIKASLRGIDMLLEEGMNIRVLLLPDNDDPDSFARKHNPEEYQDYIYSHQIDFIRFKAQILLQDTQNDPIKKSQVTRSIVESIAVIPDALIRSAYIKECSTLLDVREPLLISETAKQRYRYYEEKRKEREREEIRQQAETENSLNTPLQTTQTDSDSASTSSDATTTKIVSSSPSQEKYIKNSARNKKELQLLKAIVRYGEKPMGYIENENHEQKPISVIEYIQAEMQHDNLNFQNPAFQAIMNEACAHLHDEDFSAAKYFSQHPNPDISRISASLLSDQYQLSEAFAKERKISPEIDQLNTTVPLLMIDLKLVIVSNEMKKVLNTLQDPQIYSDNAVYTTQMKKYQSLKELQKQLTAIGGGKATITF